MRGVARLISSASSKLVKIGPGRNVNSPVFWEYTWAPVKSLGNRSGVNCTRVKRQSRDLASALISVVFPVPGKSSSRICPPHSRHKMTLSMTSPFPLITVSMLVFSRSCSRRMVSCSIVFRSTPRNKRKSNRFVACFLVLRVLLYHISHRKARKHHVFSVVLPMKYGGGCPGSFSSTGLPVR